MADPFQIALAEFQRLHAIEIAMPGKTREDEVALDAATIKTSAAFDRLCAIPATDAAGALAKIDACRKVHDLSHLPTLTKAIDELSAAIDAAAWAPAPDPEMAALFERWKLAELANHYASGCPGEVMDSLVARSSAALDDFAARPATCAEDVLLKVFTLAVIELEPKAGDRPMEPILPGDDTHGATLWASILADIAALSPATVTARAEPHRDEFRRKEAA